MALRPKPHPAAPQPTRLRRTGSAPQRRNTTIKHRRRALFAGMERLEDRVVLDASYHNLAVSNFSQNWTDPLLFTVNNNWGSVPSIMGYRGDNMTGSGGDAQTFTAEDPSLFISMLHGITPTNTTGGIGEFEALGVVGMQGSGTADAPYLLLHMNTTGRGNVNLSFNVRDIDGGADNTNQQVAVMYRVGTSGPFTNLPGGYIDDATTGPNQATLVTPVSVALPANAQNQPEVQIRILTIDAPNSDEWIGIDDILVTSSPLNTTPTITAIANATTRSYEPVTTGSFTIGDTETPVGSLQVTYTSSNPTLIPVANITTNGTGASRTATIVPAGPSGTSTITARVTDGGGLFAERTFTVTVNAAPTLRISKTVTGNPGDVIQIPITLDTNGVPAVGIGSMDIVVLYDSNVLQINPTNGIPFNPGPPPVPATPPAVTLGAGLQLVGGWSVLGNADESGKIDMSFNSNADITYHFNDLYGGGVIAVINATIKATAPAGPSPVNMVKVATVNGEDQFTWVNEGANLQLGPDPTSASNDVQNDGIVTVSGAVGQPPVNTLPIGTITGTEDINLPLNGANLISVADADSATVTTTVSVPNNTFGTFLANQGTGSVVPVFSNLNSTVTFTGSPTQVNLALATLVFVPATNRNSSDPTLTVSVSTTDGTTPDNDSFNISLTPVNDAPSFTATNPAAVNEDAGLVTVPSFITSFSAGPSNETQGVLNYLVSNVTNGSLFAVAPAVSTTGTLTYTLNPNVSGTATFALQVQDNGGTANSGVDTSTPAQTITITVNAVNDPPTLDSIGNLTVGEDALQQTVPLTGITAGPGETQPLSVTAVSSLPGIIPDPTIVYTSPSATGSLQYTPVANASGLVTITVTVTDGGLDNNLATTGDNGTFVRTFTVDVTPVNDAPTLDLINNLTVAEDALQQTVPLTGITAGPGESQPLAVTAVSSLPGIIPNPTIVYTTPSATGSLQYTPASNASGLVTITVTVTDGGLDNNLATTGDNGTFVRTFTVDVTPVNDAPTLDALSNQTIAENAPQQTVPLSGITAGGGESQTLQVTAISSLPGIIPNPTIVYTSPSATGSLQYTPVADASGLVTITVTVTDGGLDNNLLTTGDNGTFVRTFEVNVTAVNNPPTLDLLNNLTVAEDALQQTVPLTGITAGPGETQPLSVTAISSLPGIIPNPTIVYTSPGATGSLQYTPVANASGLVTITVTVTDGGFDNNLLTTADNGTFVRTFTVDVTPVNDSPTLDLINNLTVAEDALQQTVPLTGISAGGGESQPLSVSAISSLPGIIPNPTIVYTSPNATGSLQYTPVANASGLVTITVTVTDGGLDNNLLTTGDNGTFVRTFTVDVTPVNDAPTLDLINNLTVAEDALQQTVPLTGISAGGGESQPLSVTAVSSLPGIIPNPTIVYTSPSATGSLQYTPVANASGLVTITVTVTDGGLDNNLLTTADNGTFVRTFTVDVTPVDDAPTLDAIGNLTVAEDALQQTVPLTGITAGGGESQPLQVTAISSLPGIIPNPTIVYTSPNATGSLQYTPVANASGLVTITVTVTDGGLDNNLLTTADNGTFQRTFTVDVTPVNDAPTLDAISNLTVAEDALQQTVPLTGITAGGGESQPLQVTAISSLPGIIPNPTIVYTSPNATGSLQYTPVANASGLVTITVTVTDGGLDNNLLTTADNGTFVRTFTVDVTPINDAPTLDAINNLTVAEDALQQTVPLTGITAGGGESQPLSVTAISSLPGIIPNPTIVYTTPGATGSLQYTPVANANGLVTITVTVTDGGLDNNLLTTGDNGAFVRTFTVDVTPVNDVPSFSMAGNQAVPFNSPAQTVTGFITAFSTGPSNESGQTVTYTVTNDFPGLFAPGGAPAISPLGVLTYTPLANTSGTANVSVRIVDNGGVLDGGVDTSAEQTFTITVNSLVNQSPANSFPAGPVTGFEDTNLPLTGPNLISVADDSATITTTVLVPNTTFGTFLANEGAGTVTLVFANGNSSVTIIGPTSQVNLVLATLVFVPAPQRNVSDGAIPVSISTTDGTFTDNDSFQINLTAINDAPSFTTGTHPTVNEDAGAQLVPGFITSFTPGPTNEAGQEVLSYLVANLTNAGLFAVPPTVANNGTLSYTLNPNVSGTATFELRVRDDGGTTNSGVDTSAAQTITITVNAVNDAPSFTAIAPPTILEDAGPQTVNSFISSFSPGPGNDAGQLIQAYQVSGISDPLFFSSIPTVSNAGVLQYTVAANVFGTVTFQLRAQDNGGTANSGVDLSAPQTITITVTGVNDAPTFTAITPPTILEDAGPQTVNSLISSFSPGPNETSTQAIQQYLISNISDPLFFSSTPTVSPAGVLQYTVAANAFGSATFQLRAQDNGGTANSGVDTSGFQLITITVTGVNDAPSLTLGSAPTVLEDAVGVQTVPGYVTSFNPGPNESGQLVQNYTITNVSDTSLFATGPSIATNGTLTYTLAANANGIATFEVRAVDNGGMANSGVNTSAPVIGTINVTAVNDAPSFTAGTPPTVLEDSGAHSVPSFITSFSPGPANEASQQIQQYLVANISNPAFFSTAPAVSNTGTLTYTLAANASGTVTFELRARDNGGTDNSGVDTSALQLITITVTGINDAPSFTAITPPTILEDAGPQTVNGFISSFSPGPSETSQGIQAYLVSNISNPLFFSSEPTVSTGGVLQYTVAPNMFGTATFELRAQDNGGTAGGGVDTSAMQLITITVTGVNDAPSIILGVAPAVLEDAVGPQTVPGYVSLFSPGPNENSQAVQSYSIASVSNPSLFASGPSIDTNGTLSYTLAANAFGNTTFEVRVVDNGGTANSGIDTSTAVTGTINVTPVNDAPSFTVGPNQTVAYNAPAQTVTGFIPTFSRGPANEAGQTVSYTVTNDFSGLFTAGGQPAISPAGVLTYTPLANTAGTAIVSVRIVDNGGTDNGGVDTSAIQTFTITVSEAPVNAPPTINAPAPVTILEDAGLQTVILTGISAGGGEVQALTITASSADPLLIPTPVINYTSGPTGTLTFTPVAQANGSTTITITVRDAGFDGIPNNSDDAIRQVSFTVNVTALNDAPSFTAGTPPTVLEDAPAQSVNGFITSFSPGPNEATQTVQEYLVSNISNPSFFAVAPAVSTAGTLTYTLAPNVNGSVTFQLRAQDNGGTANGGVDTSAAQLITINVTAVNDAPTISAITPPTIQEDAPQQVVNSFVSFSPGPSNETSQGLHGYLISNISNPSFFAVAPAVATNGTLTYTVAAGVSGTVTFDLQARDNGGTANGGVDTSAVQTITITVAGVNDAPSFTAGTLPTVLEDAPAQTVPGFITSFSPGVGESSQAVQAYLVSNISNPAFFAVAPAVSNTGTLTYTLAPNVNGNVTFQLRVQDNGGTANGGVDTSNPQTISLNVTPVNDAPTISTITPPTVSENAGQQVVTGLVTFSPGPSNESSQGLLGYQISNISNPAFFAVAPAIGSNGTLTYTPAANTSGTVTFDLRARDNAGTANGGVDTSEIQTITITVTDVNIAPSFTTTSPLTVLEDAPAQTVNGFITSFSPGAGESGQAIQAYLVANISNPAFFTVAPAVSNTGTLTYTLAANVHGPVTFQLRAQDNGGTANGGVDTSAPQTITINVTPVNDAPTLTLGTAPTVLEDASVQTVPGYVTSFSPGPNEAGQLVQSYTITNVSNPSLFASGPAIANNGTLTYTLAANANGTTTFEVRAIDNGGTTNGGVNTSAPVIGTITVTQVNDAPSFTLSTSPVIAYNSPAQTVAGFATAISVGPTDEAGQTAGFTVSVASNPGLFLVAPSIAPNGTLTYTPAANVSGTATINVSLTDNGGTANGGADTSATQQFTITVSPAPVNNPPTISPIGNLVINEDAGLQTVNFSGVTTGGETETLTVTATSSDPTIVPNPAVTYVSPQASGSLNFTPVPNANGTVTITVTVRDPGLDTIAGNSDDGITSRTFTVTVTPINDVPSFTVGANQTVNEDSGLQTVNSWASAILAGPPNESSQVLTFNIVGNTNPTLFSAAPSISSTGVLTYTPAPNANGSATISVTLSDDAGGASTSGVQTFQITVNPVNDAPSFVAGPNQSVNEDSGPQNVSNWATSLSAGPANEASQTLTFQISGNTNPGLFAVQPTVLSNGHLSYTPAANTTGTATITLNIADNGGTANGGVDASGSQTFTITVNGVNDPPSFVAGANQSVLEDAGPQTVNPWATALSAGPANEAGQTLSFNIVGISNPSLFSAPPAISPTGVLTYTPAPNANGSATITVTLSDNGGGTNTSSPQTFQISVTPVNDAPSFLAGANQTVSEDAGPQTVPTWATALAAGPVDEAGQTLTFQVTGNSNPSLFSAAPAVQPNGTLTYTPAANAFGSATITLRLQDNGGTANGGVNVSSTQTFTITVNPVNDPPSFVAGPNQTVLEDAGPQTVTGWATSLSAGPTNEAIQTLSFAVTNNTNAALFATQPAISPTGVLTYTPAPNANGSATISVQLADSEGGTSIIRTFTITVQPVNDAPAFTAGLNQTTTEDSGNQIVNGWATGISAGPADEASQALTFLVTGNTNASLFAIAPAVTATGVLTYTPAPNANGTATITLVLQDSGGTANGGGNASAPQTFTINVTPVNDAPDATDSQFNTLVDTPVSGAVTVTDPDGPTLTYALQTLPALGTVTAFSTSTGAFTYTPNPGATGLDLFTFSVTDGTNTDTATVRIVIGATTPIVIPAGGDLQVIGTGEKDTVIISRGPTGQVLVRTQSGSFNSSQYYPLAETGTITVSTGTADDYIVINGLTNPTNIDAGAGNDYISSGTGDDLIIGGAGDDKINASGGNNVVWGDELGQQDLAAGGNDTLSSLAGNDVMYGGGGDDRIYPGDGHDYVYAGQGNDLVSAGAGNDRVFGGAGNDTLVGDAGDDIISGGSGNDFINGSDGNDVLIGGTHVDSMNGGGGNDLLIGGDTNNSVSSQAGDINDVALMALLTSWNATHAGGIANGIVLGDDGVADSLSGYTGDDDFYAVGADTLGDFNLNGMGTDRRFP